MIVSRKFWNQSLPIFNKVHSDEEDGVGEIIQGYINLVKDISHYDEIQFTIPWIIYRTV